MPYIHIQTQAPLPPERQDAVKARLGQAIGCIPGKTEDWVLAAFTSADAMYWGGDAQRPCAFVEIRIWGEARREEYDVLAGEVYKILREELDVPPERAYIHFQPGKHWAWNGAML